MGFLKKSKAPDELPDLALDTPAKSSVKPTKVVEPVVEEKPIEPVVAEKPIEPVEPVVAAVVPETPPIDSKPHHKEVKKVVKNDSSKIVAHGEKMKSKHEDIKKQISEHVDKGDGVLQDGFFDKILEDVNEDIGDLDKLGEWYEKKFLRQDVVSDMKGYWEGNKEDILIQSFGAKYKKEINERIKILQKLEGDWRDIYFKLIKKEEEMKKEERELKDTLSEFVGLCKGRKTDEKKTKKK
ncbi:hypothetical protein K8R30_02820 [archaeon]|nr:hypothetical protein [archaeon]